MVTRLTAGGVPGSDNRQRFFVLSGVALALGPSALTAFEAKSGKRIWSSLPRA